MANSSQASTAHGVTRTYTASAPSITVTTSAPAQAVLRLRGATQQMEHEVEGRSGSDITARRRRISWASDVIDNEGMGKKSSKVCCIYHAPKGIDESSDESSSDSSSDESDGGDDGAARPSRGNKAEGHGHRRDHKHQHGKGKERARSPNAYEKQPKVKQAASKS